MPPRRKPRPAPDLETNTGPGASDDLRRRDPGNSPPDSMPPRESGRDREPAGGGFSPSEDGGNPQHPVHDEDQEDRTAADYEREIDRLDDSIERRIG